MVILRGLASQGGFIAVVEQDDRGPLSAPMLRSEMGIYDGNEATLRAESATRASIELNI